MDSKRLKQIEEIYHRALEIPETERASFLFESCGDDTDLCREVEDLLSLRIPSDKFFENPPESLVAEIFASQTDHNDLIGKEIGHYKIIKLLGIGGMGEVYLANDTKLEREVALKFLPPEFAQNKDRMNRFLREAKSASTLNHPNIITIHEINEIDGTHFIATEFIEGKTLKEYSESDLSIKSVLKIAIQIASALDEAHLTGIIHRDIKPDNIMIRPNGLVKILDFGIAKLVEVQTKEDADLMQSPQDKWQFADINPQSTIPGLIIGTTNYMSPEQAKGREIDSRTDIFSFGIVLFEMLTGKLPFKGETALEMIGSILNKEPKPLDGYEVPFELKEIIGKCLRKNTDERYQTIKEVLIDLKNLERKLELNDTSQLTPFSVGKTDSDTKNIQATTADDIYQTTNEFVLSRLIFNKALMISLAILFISTAGIFGYWYLTTPKQIKSIAVMPFVNKSGNADFEYLSDGLTENLISSLSTIPNLSIKARSTVFTYKNKEITTKVIGEQLNVDAVLLGDLVQRGDNLKLNLELVETGLQNVLWTENYERKLNDLVSLQSDIAHDV